MGKVASAEERTTLSTIWPFAKAIIQSSAGWLLVHKVLDLMGIMISSDSILGKPKLELERLPDVSVSERRYLGNVRSVQESFSWMPCASLTFTSL